VKDKKALEMATGTIVTIVLGLVILVILIIFVQQQVKKSEKGYGQFGEEANISADKCQSLVMGRFCSNTCDAAKYDPVTNSPTGKPWGDCVQKKFSTCCVPK